MYFVPQFTEATDIITLESVIFPMRFCVYIQKFIALSSNNIFYIQINQFTQQTMLNQTCITRYDSLQFYIYLANTENAGSKKFIVSNSNNIYYIQIHHFTQKTMLNQWLYYTIQYLEPNTKSRGWW